MNKIFFFFFLLSVTLSTLTLQEYLQYELQTPEVIFHQIEHTDKQSHSQVPKLVFITPWNHEGKRLTIKYAKKIKYVSPCWYELIVRNNMITFQNDQLVDHQYTKEIKKSNPQIKIIPRVYVNNFQVFRLIGSSQQSFMQVLKLINEMVQNHGFDGIVWDSPFDLFQEDQQMMPLNNLIVEFVNNIKQSFKSKQATSDLIVFFNMANPSRRKLVNDLYQKLNVDGLLIQNYDSPLGFIQMLKDSVQWVKSSRISAKQVVMMLPFFSYKNGQGISTGDAKKQLLKEGIFSFGFQRGMCRFLSEKKRKYLVPCYKYFSEAYKVLEQNGYSAGFWEGGNGLQNYYLFM